MNTRTKVIGIVFIAIIGLLLFLSFDKSTPKCSDAKVSKVIGSIFTDALYESAPTSSPDDIRFLNDFYQIISLKIKSATTNGYNENSLTRSCNANFVISIFDENLTYPLRYDVQSTEKMDSFYARIYDYKEPELSLITLYKAYWYKNRFEGEWAGTFNCGPTNQPLNDDQKSFTIPISMSVRNGAITIERNAIGGGTEISTGKVRYLSNIISLSGRGSNSVDDVWSTDFEGSFNGNIATLKGSINDDHTREVLRSCAVNLKRKP